MPESQAPTLIEYTKPALTFADQLALLKGRGMTIGDPDAACRLLAQVSYYRLSGYWHPFKKSDDSFEPGATFERAVQLYEFDRRLRLCVLDGIERVEVVARTAVTYALSHAHGAFAHTLAAAFQPDFEHAEWLKALDEEVTKSKEGIAFLAHFERKYVGFPRIPIWMATEVLMFGPLSRLCKKGLLPPQIAEVAAYLGLHPTLLASWLHALSTARNICAHHGRLWNRHMGISPKLPKTDAWADVHRARVYATLLMLRKLTAAIDGGRWWSSASSLLSETDEWIRRQMSAPEDWATRPPP